MKHIIDLDKINLGDEIQAILTAYSRVLQDDMNELAKKYGKETVKKLRANSPKRTGEYAKGWTTRTSTNTKRDFGRGFKTTVVTVYNKKKGPLTHLLEKGHTNRNGGYVAPIPHIQPVAKEIEDKFLKEAIEMIKNEKNN